MGLVDDQAATRKSAKYADFTAACIFQPIVVENLGPISSSALNFPGKWARKSVTFPATTGRLSFYSSVSLRWSNVSTQCFCTTHSALTASTNSHASYVFTRASCTARYCWEHVLAMGILSVRLSQPGTDSSPGQIEAPGLHHMIAWGL